MTNLGRNFEYKKFLFYKSYYQFEISIKYSWVDHKVKK